MAKLKTKFFCQQCGHEEFKWVGRCPGCGAWNTMVEELVSREAARGGSFTGGIWPDSLAKPQPITEIGLGEEIRLGTGSQELDRVLGGGIVPGSLVLVGGDPGIGKSTLLLQVANAVSRINGPVIYASGEESDRQIGMRAQRLGALGSQLFVLAETNLGMVEGHLSAIKPRVLIVDSIQTVFREEISSAPGSVGQVRECTAHLLRMAKSTGTAIFLVGHVTKEGAIAGPRVLEHMVDTVLYFEGERHNSFRVLRAVKNRFGSTNEIGIFEMTEGGLREVVNPSELFMAQRPKGEAGSVVTVSMEGTRPVLVEIQALVTPTTFGMPRRMTAGVDFNRVVLIAAVLEKRVGLHLGSQDIYVNVAGGVKLSEPAVDLGIAMALASSLRDRPLDPGLAVMGEIGLTGEIRAVSHLEKRVREAAKLGFTSCVVPAANARKLQGKAMQIIGTDSVLQALDEAFGGV
ncbi:MAG: DNA repair protein RadA [Clostridia bacterium]|nr:DNA repair protein RadA [Clostridia bacterium]